VLKSLKKTKAPLQSLSTSMPMTCAKMSTSVCEPEAEHAQGRGDYPIADILEKVTHPINGEFLDAFIRDTVASLKTEFFAATGCPKLDAVQEAARRGTHTERLAIFYLLLNIDAPLKTRILCMDEGNKAKIGRFLQDLRNELVTTYFCSSQSVPEFAKACKEAYWIA
jgi:hypothetical protein